jgi:hypothetical protein
MLQTISADKIALYDLEQRFGLMESDEPVFFEEWQTDLPTLTTVETDRLVRVRTAQSIALAETRTVALS